MKFEFNKKKKNTRGLLVSDLPFPCVGLILALRGTDGAELWRLMTYSGVTDIKCDVIDVNGDGRNDCIAAGRMGTLIAIDVRNGKFYMFFSNCSVQKIMKALYG